MTVFKVFPKRLKKIYHEDVVFKIKNNLGKYSQLHAFFFSVKDRIELLSNMELQPQTNKSIWNLRKQGGKRREVYKSSNNNLLESNLLERRDKDTMTKKSKKENKKSAFYEKKRLRRCIGISLLEKMEHFCYQSLKYVNNVWSVIKNLLWK